MSLGRATVEHMFTIPPHTRRPDHRLGRRSVGSGGRDRPGKVVSPPAPTSPRHLTSPHLAAESSSPYVSEPSAAIDGQAGSRERAPQAELPRSQSTGEVSTAGEDLAGELARLSSAVAALLPRIPETGTRDEVDAWFAALKRLDGASSAIRARLIDCLQRSRTPQESGHSGAPSYLREHLGVSGREASKQDSLARDLRHLPGTAAALAAGDIGPEQAGAIGQASRRGVLGTPGETEDQLLPVAREGSTDGLRRHIRDAEHRADRESLKKQERRQQALRSASLNRRGDGMWELYARLPSEPGEQLAVALEAFRTPDGPDTPMVEQRSSDKRTADALSDLVRAVLRGGVPIAGGVRPQLNVTIPIELLSPDGEGSGVTDHGGVLSSAAVQRLSCYAAVRWILTRGSTEILDVGRTKSRWSTAQRRALVVRDGGCRGPGCDRPPAWCDAHHVKWWSQDGTTSLDNGLLLCRRHHRLVHDDGWSLDHDARTGRATFTSPTGRTVTTWPHGTASGAPRSEGGGRNSPCAGRASVLTVDPGVRPELRGDSDLTRQPPDGANRSPAASLGSSPLGRVFEDADPGADRIPGTAVTHGAHVTSGPELADERAPP